MSIRSRAAEFFRNIVDYLQPHEPQGIHSSPLDQELRRQSQGNFTGKEWTPAQAYRKNVGIGLLVPTGQIYTLGN